MNSEYNYCMTYFSVTLLSFSMGFSSGLKIKKYTMNGYWVIKFFSTEVMHIQTIKNT